MSGGGLGVDECWLSAPSVAVQDTWIQLCWMDNDGSWILDHLWSTDYGENWSDTADVNSGDFDFPNDLTQVFPTIAQSDSVVFLAVAANSGYGGFNPLVTFNNAWGDEDCWADWTEYQSKMTSSPPAYISLHLYAGPDGSKGRHIGFRGHFL